MAAWGEARARRHQGGASVRLPPHPARHHPVDADRGEAHRELGFKEVPALLPLADRGCDLPGPWTWRTGRRTRSATRTSSTSSTTTRRGRARCSSSTPASSEAVAAPGPRSTWIGCSDSRAGQPDRRPAAGRGLRPPQHRQRDQYTDLNALAVIQYAVDVLQVKHIMVVGHYGCGGVKAALERARVGLVDLWLRHVQDVHVRHLKAVDSWRPNCATIACASQRHRAGGQRGADRSQDAWRRGQRLTVHGWIYGLKDGLIRDLGMNLSRSRRFSCRATSRRWRRSATERRANRIDQHP